MTKRKLKLVKPPRNQIKCASGQQITLGGAGMSKPRPQKRHRKPTVAQILLRLSKLLPRHKLYTVEI